MKIKILLNFHGKNWKKNCCREIDLFDFTNFFGLDNFLKALIVDVEYDQLYFNFTFTSLHLETSDWTCEQTFEYLCCILWKHSHDEHTPVFHRNHIVSIFDAIWVETFQFNQWRIHIQLHKPVQYLLHIWITSFEVDAW